jgi:hypothetical protein
MATITKFPALCALSFLTLLSQASASCKNFTQSGYEFTTVGSPTQRISQGYNCDVPNSNYANATAQRCDAKTECPVTFGGIVSATGTNNLSLSEDDILPIYSLVSKTSTTKPFLYSYSTDKGNSTSCIGASSANSSTPYIGYYTYTPFLFCVNGTLSECSNGPVDEGTAIQICAVETFGGFEDPQVDGEINFVSTDDASVANATSNPALTATPLATLPKGVLMNAADGLSVRAGFWVAMGAVLGSSLIL